MLREILKKKNSILKKDLKRQSQPVLTFKNYDRGHEPRTSLVEGKPCKITRHNSRSTR